MMNQSIQILYRSYESTTSTTVLKADHILISANLNEKLHKAHPLPNPQSIMPMCKEVFPKVVCIMDYSLEKAILLYRKLFYSTFEIAPNDRNINSLLDHIDKWTLHSTTPVIIDYGGAFQTKHLHLIQYAFPQAEIYSVDTLYEELDLLVCNINRDETKWCFIPVFCRTGEFNQCELIDCVQQELQGSSSFWNGIEIVELNFLEVNHLQVYDPYSEILGLRKINFIDTTEKCKIIPCCLFMAYHTYSATPFVEQLQPIGLIDRIHTKVDMDYACDISSSLALDKHKEAATTTNSSRNKWDNVRAKLDELKSRLPERTKISPSSSINFSNWLDIHTISKLLDGKLSTNAKRRNFDDSMAKLFGITGTFLTSVDCLNLSSFIAQNGIEALTSSNVQQLIEQHVGGFWKNDDINVHKYPRNFVKECLQVLLGSVTNIHIHIDSYQALLYSFEVFRQLKHEDPNLHIEFSLTEEIKTKPCQSAVVLAFECNQNYVLVYAELDHFIERMTKCTSLDDIQATVESSVAFGYALSRGQHVKWHRNLSFVYVAALQNSIIKQIEDRLLALGLRDINFISKTFKHLNLDEPQQCHMNQAIICFQFHPAVSYDRLPSNSNLLDQWIFDENTYKFTGPIVTLYPNVSKYTINHYATLTPRTTVGCVYNLLFDDVSVLFQWRSS